MASLRRKPNSPFWIACYTTAEGVRRQASTGLEASRENEREAQRIADDYEVAVRRKKTETQIRRVLSDICERNNGAALCEHTLDGWLTHWLTRVQPEVKPRAYKRYANALDLVRTVDADLCAKKLDLVTTADVEDLRPKLHATRSAATTNFTLKILRMAFKRAGALLLHNPAAGVKPVKKTEAEMLSIGAGKQPFTREQLQVLFKKADDEWKGMILAGLYSAGQRLGDIATMTANQIDLQAGVARFKSEKTDRPTIVPLVPAWRADLEERLRNVAPNAPLFPRAHGKCALSDGNANDVSKSFRRLLHACGMAPKVGPREGSIDGRRRPLPYSFHSFRHTMTSWMANAGVSKTVAMDLVGHDSAAISALYTHIENDTKRNAMLAATKGLRLTPQRMRKAKVQKAA